MMRTRALVALLGAAVLGLGACGTNEEPPAPGTSTTSESPSEPTSSTSTTSESESSSTTDEEPTGRTDIVFVPDPAGPAGERISAEDLESELSAPFAHPATCRGDLALERGATQQCEGVIGLESQEEATWTAHAVSVMDPRGYEHGVTTGVLFTTGPPLGEEVTRVLGTNVTGVGIGSMFGAEPLTAADLGDATLTVLTSDNAFVPVDEVADWSGVTCEEGMDFEDFRPVACTAETADGGSWSLRVLPGTFADMYDRGLLVGIDGPHEAPATD